MRVKEESRMTEFLDISNCKAMANLDSIVKSRDITLATKVCIVKALVSAVAGP